jgi:hypothetical protein
MSDPKDKIILADVELTASSGAFVPESWVLIDQADGKVYGKGKMVDYRELLLKYIQHVKERAGVDYIVTGEKYPNKIRFTDREFAELEALALVAREME